MSSGRTILVQVVAFLAVGLVSVTHADEGLSQWKLSGGLGFGMLHSGYGINLGIKNDSSLIFGSMGCDAYASLNRCDDRFSIGYLRTGMIGSGGDRHALGIYVGQFDRSKDPESEATRGLGVGYVFFPSGISQRGFSLGLGYETGQTDGRTDHHRFRVQVGVQF